MSIWMAILYGAIQGLTEFLPVSSSGHLALAHNLFKMEDLEANQTFDILLHLATLIVVIFIYRKEIWELIVAFFTLVGKLLHGNFKYSSYSPNERFVILVIIATLPLVFALFIDEAVAAVAGYSKIIGGILIFNGLVLLLSDRFGKGNTEVPFLKKRNALVVGFCQLLAIFPGLSRSGSTITGGLFCGLTRRDAVKYSFILSIPAIIGANIMNVPDIIKTPVPQSDIAAYIAGMLAAAAVGFAAIKLLIFISKNSSFRYFAYYCFAIGAVAVIFG